MYAHILNTAIDEALKSTHHKARVGAVIFRKKKIISAAFNKPFAWSNKLRKDFRKWPHGLHAEAAAILKARGDLNGVDIFVVRVGLSGVIRMARPCEFCMKFLRHVGIRRITYSDENGQFITIKVNDVPV